MKSIVVIHSKNKLKEIDIDLLEQKLEVLLPQDYRDFLFLHNGGHPEKDCYTSIDDRMSSDLDRFFSYYEGDNCINILKEKMRFKDRIPKCFLPIAHDSGSNKICIGINGSEYGKVYFWDFDQAVPYGEEPTYDNMYLLANNFTDFINSLYKFVDLKKDDKGEEIWVYAHDKYSLPFSTEARKYGEKVTGFFAKAPAEVEDYIIEEAESSKNLLLWYEEKSTGKKYFRKISKGEIVEDYEE
jgi:cell wall assembly regulator SMI1